MAIRRIYDFKLDARGRYVDGVFLLEKFLGGNDISDMIFDGVYLYAARLYQVYKIDLKRKKVVAISPSYGTYIYRLAYDGTYLYCAGASTVGRVWKINPTDMSKMAETNEVYSGHIYGLATDGTNIYCSGIRISGKPEAQLWKLNRNTLAKIAESNIPAYISYASLVYADGYLYNDYQGSSVMKIRTSDLEKVAESPKYDTTIRTIAYDGNYIYMSGGGHTGYGRVWKIDPRNMNKIAQSPVHPGNNVQAITTYNKNIYCSGAGGVIWKLDPLNMQVLNDWITYDSLVRALTLDAKYLYCGGNKLGKIIDKIYLKN